MRLVSSLHKKPSPWTGQSIAITLDNGPLHRTCTMKSGREPKGRGARRKSSNDDDDDDIDGERGQGIERVSWALTLLFRCPAATLG